ncbi:putative casparian strip membrane protein [Helianthus annuus]|nr:putative casparian strip membrane protein [Helianthus annuus]
MERQNKVAMINGGRRDMAVRVLALVLTLAAAVVVGVNKQSTTVPITIVASLPPVYLPVTAKWLHMSAFVYVSFFFLSFATATTAGKTN